MDCETVSSDLPLRQGDILKQIGSDGGRVFRIVVSADCDLAQNKGVERGTACVDLEPLETYITGPFAAQLLHKHYSRAMTEVCDWIRNKWLQIHPASELDYDAVVRWILVAPIEEIEQTLQLPPQPDQGLLRRGCIALKKTRQCLDQPIFSAIVECLLALQKQDPQDIRKFLTSQFSRLDPDQLPDDLFFVTELPGEDGLGYIANLRSLSFVDLKEIASSIPEARDRGSAYVRIARLAPTFKHGMAQQLGVLFARIGFPRAYEETRHQTFSIVIDDIVSRIGVTP